MGLTTKQFEKVLREGAIGSGVLADDYYRVFAATNDEQQAAALIARAKVLALTSAAGGKYCRSTCTYSSM